MKRQSLSRAFDILKMKVEDKFVLDFKRFNILLKMIPPSRSPMMINILWYVLDSDGDNKIGNYILITIRVYLLLYIILMYNIPKAISNDGQYSNSKMQKRMKIAI